VTPPIEGDQILRSERNNELNLDRDGHLRSDELDSACNCSGRN
jgi:hypothetical protein